MLKEKKEALKYNSKNYIALIGFVLSFLIIYMVVINFFKYDLLRWPFRRVFNINTAYISILDYLPMLLFIHFSFIWLKYAQLPYKNYFKWKKKSWIFFSIGLLISISYSIVILSKANITKGFAYWPPVIIFSLINSYSEEVLFRVIFLSILNSIFNKYFISNIIQSAYYSLLHIYIGGPIFGLLSFAYGLLLGIIAKKNASIIPCIFCHFLIDIGVIGIPILS